MQSRKRRKHRKTYSLEWRDVFFFRRFNKAFERVNNVLYDGVKAVTDVIIKVPTHLFKRASERALSSSTLLRSQSKGDCNLASLLA